MVEKNKSSLSAWRGIYWYWWRYKDGIQQVFSRNQFLLKAARKNVFFLCIAEHTKRKTKIALVRSCVRVYVCVAHALHTIVNAARCYILYTICCVCWRQSLIETIEAQTAEDKRAERKGNLGENKTKITRPSGWTDGRTSNMCFKSSWWHHQRQSFRLRCFALSSSLLHFSTFLLTIDTRHPHVTCTNHPTTSQITRNLHGSTIFWCLTFWKQHQILRFFEAGHLFFKPS